MALLQELSRRFPAANGLDLTELISSLVLASKVKVLVIGLLWDVATKVGTCQDLLLTYDINPFH